MSTGTGAPRPRVVAIVQARMASTRLPGKVLAEAAGRTLLAHVVERLRRATALDDVTIATSDGPADDPIAREAERLGVAVVRGSETDVLDRFRLAAAARGAGVVVRITADCPLLDPAEVDRVVSVLLAQTAIDYATNHPPEGRRVPLGQAVEAMTREALERAAAEATEPHQREHVTPYLYERPGRFRVAVTSPPGPDRSAYRLTVDTPEDLAVVRAVIEALEGIEDPREACSLEAAVRALEARPDLAALNAGVRQKGYRESAAPRATSLSSATAPTPSATVAALSVAAAARDATSATTSASSATRARESATVAAPPILIRADAGARIGLGHAMRCLALAEAWRELGGPVAIASVELPASVAARFERAGVAIEGLAGVEIGSPEDARATIAAARARGAKWIVADGYALAADYLALLRGEGRLVALVDDHGLAGSPVDLIVNPNAGAGPELYAASRARVLAGAPYALLRATFRKGTRRERRFDARPLALLLAFGGSDPPRLSARAVRAAIAGPVATGAAVVTAILGPAAENASEVEAVARAAPAGTVRVLRDVDDVAPEYDRADLAFAAAGSMGWELAFRGVPMLVTTVADNQRVVANALAAAGAARYAGDAVALDDARLAREIDAFVALSPAELRAMAQAAMTLVDGRGAERVARALLALARDMEMPP